MPVLMFQERFAPKVADGSKRRTIRPERKNPIRIGDALSLRKWSAKPYRSKQVELKSAVCVDKRRVEIVPSESSAYPITRLLLDGIPEGADQQHWFAINDGFESWADMVEWFRNTHGLPFSGVMIRW